LTWIYVCAHIWRIFPFIGSSAENRGTPGITGSSIVHALCSLILLYMYVQISIISGSWPSFQESSPSRAICCWQQLLPFCCNLLPLLPMSRSSSSRIRGFPVPGTVDPGILPGSRRRCVATGATREDVEERMHEAIEFHIEGLREDGLPIPPSRSSAIYVAVGRG